jgi:transposase
MMVPEERSTKITKSKPRSFTAEFKAQVVLEVISGVKTFAEMCRRYQLNDQTLSRWKQEFVQRAALVFEHPGQNGQDQQRIADLERMIGSSPSS